LNEALEKEKDHMSDPYCVGFFINNELHWKVPLDYAKEVVKTPAKTAAKQAFAKFLENRLGLKAFNTKLGTSFSTWDDFLAQEEALDLKAIELDVEDFYRSMCDRYFKQCRDALKTMSPSTLYLGCRFHVNRPIAVASATRYCDVVSFNVYEFGIDTFDRVLVDVPFITGEFHYGAFDRGMFAPGLKWASDQDDRAKLYRDYVRGALGNKKCVGVHWFQYPSQSFTGRGDGENYQVGILDIADQPNPELREAIRGVGYELYERRYPMD
jgi:hypothetical protein